MNRIICSLILSLTVLSAVGCGPWPHERLLPNLTYVSNYRLGGTVILIVNAAPGVGMDVYVDGQLRTTGLEVTSPPFRIDTFNPYQTGDLPMSVIVKGYTLDDKHTYMGVAERTFSVGREDRSTETWVVGNWDLRRD